MSIKPINIVLLCLLAVSFFSCQDEEQETPTNEEGTMSISLSVPSKSDNDYITYAMPGDEDKIEHIAVLAFKTDPTDPTNVAKGTFLYKSLVSYNRPNPTSCVIKVKEMPDAQTFVVIANARDIVDNTAIAEGETKAAVIQKLLMNQNTAFDATTMTSIPMWGEVQNKVVNNGVVPTGLNCKLYRMLAKINVSVDNTIPVTDFKLTTVHLYMPRQKGTLIPDNWGTYTPHATETTPPDEAVTTPTQPAAAGTIPARATKYVYNTTTNKVENIYTFETKNVATPALNMLDQACLVVGGEYDGEVGKTYYYRVDFKSGATQLDILRNFIYNVKITTVGGMGVEDPDDAYKGLSVIEASIEPWNQATGEVQIGQTHLYVSQRYPWLKCDGVTEPFEKSREVTIRSSDPNGWTFKNDAVTQQTLTDFGVSNLTQSGAMDQNVVIHWTPGVAPTAGRESKAIIVSGNLEYTINFIQDDCGRFGIAQQQQIGTNNYKTHRYGTDCWMVENSKEGTSEAQQYGSDPSKVNGYYYKMHQRYGACPAGWHVPTIAEYMNLMTNVNTNLNTSTTSIWWAGNRACVPDLAFAGRHYSHSFGSAWGGWRLAGWWWLDSSDRAFKSDHSGMVTSYENVGYGSDNYWSVRCVQD